MRRLGAALALAAASQFAAAAGPHGEAGATRVDGPPGLLPGAGVDADVVGTRDTDGFVATHARAGLLWSHESLYRFSGIHVGADHYHQSGWSMRGASLLGAYRDVERATGAGLTVLGGAARAGNATRLVGEVTWNRRFSEATGIELLGNRTFVETRAGLERAVMSSFVAASVDRAVGDRVTLIGLAGAQVFSDDNARLHLRGRGFYLLAPEYGFSAEARVRAYESSRPGPAAYFNPEHYVRGEIGLRLRRSFGDWRAFAELGGGRESVDLNFRNPTYYGGLQAQRSFARDVALAFSYTAQRSSEGDGATSIEGRYRWQFLRVFLIVGF